MLITVTAAASLPVTVAEAREHCRAPENGDDDALIERFLRAAVEYAQNHCSLIFAPTTLQYRRDDWPSGWCCEIDLPRAPVRDVVSVEYVDVNGAVQEVSALNWNWKRTADGARIRFKSDYGFPTITPEEDDGLRVTFEAGYEDPAQSGSGDDPDLKLPELAKIAILMLTSWWYGNREAASVDATHPVVISAEAILAQLKVYR